ncbi:hypothetical protein PMEL1_01203 [Prevotella melaninogenica]|uniref:Uncharacterized protein n=1 Tax=Prevotella melaninogenica TaxID=28132 RepID=A0A250KN27_9BACT|nr:hypothetical protein PMEL1_01203 [Prevotella melaninogenica]
MKFYWVVIKTIYSLGVLGFLYTFVFQTKQISYD